MSRPHGRARVDASSPRAFAICDRCGFLYNHGDLRWQMDYRGGKLSNIRRLVCDTCYDEPQPQLRIKILPPDPRPILNARPASYAIDETNFRTTSGQDTIDPVTGIPVPGKTRRTTQGGVNRVTQSTGAPSGSLTTTPGVDTNVPGGDDPGLPYGFDQTPTTE